MHIMKKQTITKSSGDVDKKLVYVYGHCVWHTVKTSLVKIGVQQGINYKGSAGDKNKRWKDRNVSNFRADFRLEPSQWETLLQSNAGSHWLGTDLEIALNLFFALF